VCVCSARLYVHMDSVVLSRGRETLPSSMWRFDCIDVSVSYLPIVKLKKEGDYRIIGIAFQIFDIQDL
jgi:hypothetical protein